MKKRFRLFYLFQEDKAQTKMTEEKSAEIYRTLEQFFLALRNNRKALPTEGIKDATRGEKTWKDSN